MDNSKATTEWLNSCKSERTKREYNDRFAIWLEYCAVRGIPTNGDAQLEDMQNRRLSKNNTEKYFYDSEVPNFYQWLRTEYKQKKGRNLGKPLSEASALAHTTAIRSFFSYHRYSLEIQKDALPSSEKIKGIYEDMAFDIYMLRAMAQQGDLFERTVLSCGKDLWLRASDFVSLDRDTIEYLIQNEKTLAEKEAREQDIIEFEIITQKEKEPCSCHLSKETIALLEDYLKTYPKKNGSLFPIGEEALTDVLRRLATKAKISIKPNTRIVWHCLRKYGITVMHGKVTEPVLKYMTGKHIGKDLKVYIQENNEPKTAFRDIEPIISLTKTNGNGNTQLAKQLEEMKKERYKTLFLIKILEKTIGKGEMHNAIREVINELKLFEGEKIPDMAVDVREDREIDFNKWIEVLAEKYEKKDQKDLERILKENGDNNHD